MVAKLYTKPFGVAGDKTPIPNDTQVDGTVSYQTGFGADYERQLGVDPAAKNIGRQTFNELMFDATTALQEMQAGFGTSVYSLSLAQSLPGGGYPKGALIPRFAGDGFWLCTTAANTSNPDTGGAGWMAWNPPGSLYAIDTGVANAYSCVFSPALTARSETQPLVVKIKVTNTGASTINDGLGTVPLVGLAQAPLQGGEVTANGVALLQWVAAIASYIVVYATGGRVQAANATKSLHAVNAGQIQTQELTAFTSAGTAPSFTLAPIPAITTYAAGQRFRVKFNAAGNGSDTLNVSGLGVKNIKQYDYVGAKVAPVIAANQLADVEYDGSEFVILDPLPVNYLIDPWALQPIGTYIPVRDDLSASLIPPNSNPNYRYIKLTASDAYNTGALVSESTTGSAPLVVSTGVISYAGSLINGKTINLINTEGRVLRGGNSGAVLQDAVQHHNHSENVGTSNTASSTSDTLSSYTSGLSGAGAYYQRLPTTTGVNNVAIGGPISSVAGGTVRTDTETRAKSIGVTYYMRIK